MNKNAIKTIAITLVGTFLVACGASLEEYQKFSTAGKEYAVALDSLLVTSGKHFVDSNSEKLLRTDLNNNDPELLKKQEELYHESTENIDTFLTLIGQMRQHTDLLKRYFIALENLAASNAPEKATQATEKIFTELNSVSQVIQGSQAIQQSPLVSANISSAVSQIPQLVLNAKIKGALRKELEMRKEAIYKELEIQQVLLEFLTVQLQDNLKSIRDNQDVRLILPAYQNTVPIKNPDEWIAQRRSIRSMTLQVEALNNASQAAEELKESFQAVLADEFTIGRANALLVDIKSLLSIAEELKKRPLKRRKLNAMQAITIIDAQKRLEFYKTISDMEVKLFLPGIESKIPAAQLQKFKLDRMQWSLFVQRVAINIASIILIELENNALAFEEGIQFLEEKLQEMNDTVAILDTLAELLVTIGRIITVVV